MPIRSPVLALAGLAFASAAALAQPDPRMPYRQPPPRSHYADGTGNSDVDRLNAGELDENYRGPWHPVPPGRGMTPGPMAPGSLPPGPVPPGFGPLGPVPPPPGQF